MLSNKIAALCVRFSLAFLVTKDKIYQPADDGNDGDKVPDDFNFY
jgi:hypothetical protein